MSDWEDRIAGRVCVSCGARRELFVVWVWLPARRSGSGWLHREQPARTYARARCIDQQACTARVAKRSDRARERSSVIHVFPRPCADPPAGACQWCGEPIVLANPLDYRRAQRSVHRGDEHEVGDRNCAKERHGSRAWNAREAIERHAQHVLQVNRLVCVDCDTVVDELRDGCWHGTQEILVGGKVEVAVLRAWEADHELALEDGGSHTMENLRCRCVPCHKAKTARENSARAARARALAYAQELVDAGQASLLEATFIADALAGEAA